MIRIILPTKVLDKHKKQNYESDHSEINTAVDDSLKSIINSEVIDIIEEWWDKYPELKGEGFNLSWGSYLDVSGRKIICGSDEWADLYKPIKRLIMDKKFP